MVSEKGDARLLEIGGTASNAVIEYVRVLRELALESVHGNRASADRIAAAQSGRALELMNQGLIWLADNLPDFIRRRRSVGLARMALRASHVYDLKIGGHVISALDATVPISLVWPRWYPPDALDRQHDAQTLSTLSSAGHISRETAVRADLVDIRHSRCSRGTREN